MQHELILNTHMHTTYSDGSGSHATLAAAALEARLDAIIVTDHNVYVSGVDGYHYKGEHRLLLMAGEEVHDAQRVPQKNHLLVFGAGREMAMHAPDPQRLIDQIARCDGLSFLAHPNDDELKAFKEDDISWEDWNVRGYTGLELWNGFSELKSVVKGKLDALFYAFFPQYLARGPHPRTLKRWDELTLRGQKVAAICGSDAHALHMRMGPLRRTIFPYSFHFRALNNHLLVPSPLTGDLAADRQMIYNALRSGRNFIGYDLPAATRGFRFTAQGRDTTATMGEEIRLPRGSGVTFQIRLPKGIKAECVLLCNGQHVRTWTDREICAHIASQPGVYRVEVYLEYLGRRRGWIYSNPIYLRG